MEEIIVYGDNPLKGTVEIEGAKNAVLPILAASLLAEDGTTRLSNVPILSDVFTMKEVIHHLNAQVDFNLDKKEITVNASSPLEVEAPYEYVSKMRASIVVLGPLLARNGHAKVAMPGGCAIGKRPIGLHLKGFQALGATIHQRNGYIEAVADQLEGNSIYLDFPSVGATQNIMMAAVKAKGTTTIDNVAREPEIVDLANLLNKMGAKIHGAGTETIRIEGVEHLYAVQHVIVQDRIEAGTFMVAGAMPNNDLFIKDAIAEHNRPLLSKLKEMGAEITETEDGIQIKGPEQLQPTDVKTLPHPGFPTDMQAQTSVLQLLANGTSVTTETVFENRFQHLEEMRKMNAHMKIDGNVAIMQGNDSLQGGVVYATDLRAAAALVLAGLKAEGITRVRNLKYLDRGYYHFHEKLQKLGANIERVSDNSVKEEVHV